MATRYSSALISLGTPTIIRSTPLNGPGQTLPAPRSRHACPGHGRSPQTFDQTWAHESRERDRDWHAAKLRLTRVVLLSCLSDWLRWFRQGLLTGSSPSTDGLPVPD